MPQLGRDIKKKEKPKKADFSAHSSKEVVSAYSEEGERRNEKRNKPLGLGFKVGLLIAWTLLAVAAFLIIMGPSFGWW